MRRLPAVLALLFLVSANTVWAQEAEHHTPRIDLPEELDRVLRDYEQGWRAGDSVALSELFTTDGFILRPGHRPVRGRDSIEEAYRGSQGGLILTAYAYAMDGDVGYILGGYRYNPDGEDSGKYTLVLRRVDGKWLIASDMDNGNR